MMIIILVTTTALTAARYRCNMEFPRPINSYLVGFVPLRLPVDAPFLPRVVHGPLSSPISSRAAWGLYEASHSCAFEQALAAAAFVVGLGFAIAPAHAAP